MPPAASPPCEEDGSTPEVSKFSSLVEIDSQGEGLGIVPQEVTMVSESLNQTKAEEETEVVSKNTEGSFPVVSTSQPVSDVPVEKKSWVRVAQKHTFTKQDFVISEVDGQQRVVVPKGVFEGAKPLWEDFLIGKFLNTTAPHVGNIHMIVNKIWRLGDKSSIIDVYAVNDTTVKFRVRKEAMRQRILNRGMWNIMGIPMLISKWTPFAEEAQPAMKSIPLWVVLKNVPPTMFTDKGLEYLSSAVGKPLRLHPKTEACVSFEEAQILVEADLTKALPTEYHITGEEEGEVDVVISYSYPWLPPRCSHCKKWGHIQSSCLAVNDTKVSHAKSSSQDLNKVNETDQTAIVAVPSQGSVAKANTSDNLIPHSPKENVGGEGKVVTETENDQWITPHKSSRSPNKKKEELKFGEVSILSNTYAVLSDKKEGDEEALKEGKSDETEQVVDDKENNVENMEENSEILKGNKETKAKEAKDAKEPPMRQYLPRGTKTSKKNGSKPSTQHLREQSKRTTQQ